jgi:hypothetical protein
MRFAVCIAILAISGCRAPVLPDGEVCGMIEAASPEDNYLLCIRRSNGEERKISSEYAFKEGYVAVSPEYYAEIELYRKSTRRWVERYCR